MVGKTSISLTTLTSGFLIFTYHLKRDIIRPSSTSKYNYPLKHNDKSRVYLKKLEEKINGLAAYRELKISIVVVRRATSSLIFR